MKNLCFLSQLNQYKDIRPLNNVVALQQKFFSLPPFIAMSFNATEQAETKVLLTAGFHEREPALSVILSPRRSNLPRRPSCVNLCPTISEDLDSKLLYYFFLILLCLFFFLDRLFCNHFLFPLSPPPLHLPLSQVAASL